MIPINPIKSKQQISMDYNRVLSLTAELDRLADELSKEINAKTENNLGLLLSGWEGENASQFSQKISEMQGNSQKTAEAIKKISAGIRSNAQNVYNAEMEAIRIAETFSGGGK